jgi:hypothetical protein
MHTHTANHESHNKQADISFREARQLLVIDDRATPGQGRKFERLTLHRVAQTNVTRRRY